MKCIAGSPKLDDQDMQCPSYMLAQHIDVVLRMYLSVQSGDANTWHMSNKDALPFALCTSSEVSLSLLSAAA